MGPVRPVAPVRIHPSGRPSKSTGPRLSGITGSQPARFRRAGQPVPTPGAAPKHVFWNISLRSFQQRRAGPRPARHSPGLASVGETGLQGIRRSRGEVPRRRPGLKGPPGSLWNGERGVRRRRPVAVHAARQTCSHLGQPSGHACCATNSERAARRRGLAPWFLCLRGSATPDFFCPLCCDTAARAAAPARGWEERRGGQRRRRRRRRRRRWARRRNVLGAPPGRHWGPRRLVWAGSTSPFKG
eukprot:gene10737-biopygen12349